MMDHSMSTTRNNGGGSKNHLSSLQDGSAYRQAYFSTDNSAQNGQGNDDYTVPIVFLVVTVVFVLLRLLCYGRQEQLAGDGDRVGQPSLPTSRAGGLVDRDPSTVAAVEVPPPVRADEPPLVCTYRKADGWRDDSCGVCLAELADGEDIRVLPACMHFFHAACVNEWLRAQHTCPLCRAALVAPADTT